MKIIYQHLPTLEIGGLKLVGVVLFGLLVLLSAAVGATAGLLLVYSTDLPQVEELERYRPSSVTELYDGQGRVIGTFALQRRVIAAYDDYPEVLRNALVSIEDKDFYRHSGINIWRIVGAAYRDIESGGKVQGASTLTMQLARNLFLSPDRSFYRKVQEALLAIQIERRFTKPQIFTLYANQIFLGHGAYGYEAASQYYFSKPARQLKLEEAALLAGLAAYERRHGWHGKLLNVIAQGQKLGKYEDLDWDEEPEINGYVHALVIQVSPAAAAVRFGQHVATLAPADVAWTKLKPKSKLPDILHAGDVVYIKVLSLDAGGKSRVSLE